MQVTPYLCFEGRCDEALQFYADAIGAKTAALMRFSEGPQAPDAGGCGEMPAAVTGDKVMHAEFTVGDTRLMASDGRCTGAPRFDGIALTIQARDDAHAEQLFGALSAGGKVEVPLAQTFFASRFGMVADRFGVGWMILSNPASS
ncbi:MAG TPA: VOC family protein [Zeimonas sp.]